MGVIKKILFRWKKDIALVKTLTLSTTSNLATWSPFSVTNLGSTLTWKATGGVTETIIADDPTFNLSTNVGTVNFEVYDVSDVTVFKVTSLSPNLEIASIDVSDATELLDLHTGFNTSITSLDVTNNTLLTTLRCNGNSITTLDLTNNTALTILGCYGTNLTSIDLSNNVLLNNVRVDNTSSLTSVNLTNCSSIDYFGCESTSISTLDLTDCTSLTYLRAEDTLLTTLDISNNTLIDTLVCFGNNFSSTVTNSILASLVSHGLSNGILSYRNNETGQGVTDRATLVTRGWSITNYAT